MTIIVTTESVNTAGLLDCATLTVDTYSCYVSNVLWL